jgi:nuclear transcription factor Y alpha
VAAMEKKNAAGGQENADPNASKAVSDSSPASQKRKASDGNNENPNSAKKAKTGAQKASNNADESEAEFGGPSDEDG